MKQIFLKSITVMLFSLLYVTAVHALEVNGIAYFLNESERTASVANSTNYSGDVVIPSTVTYEGKTYIVTEIERQAFMNCTSLISIKIPKTIEKIGTDAFSYCSNLTSIYYNAENAKPSLENQMTFNQVGTAETGLTITIGKDVKVIPNRIFGQQTKDRYGYTVYVNEKIKNLVFEAGSTCTKIEHYAFEGCSGLTDVVLPNTITEIMFSAFDHCSGMESILLPESLTKIGSDAFSDCSKLRSIVIPENVTSIGYRSFEYCSGLTEIIFNAKNATNDIDDSDYGAFNGMGRSGVPISITIGKNVKSIPDYLFCQKNTNSVPVNVEFEEGSICTYIGKSAFGSCKGLTHIELPNSVTSTVQPFYSTGITEPIYTSKIFFYLPRTIAGEYEIPEGITTIVNGAASDCANLTKIILPTSITTIREFSFQYATGLTSILIPKNVTSIENYAFSGCSNLKTVYNASNLPITAGTTTYGYIAYYATKVINGYDYTIYNGNSVKNVGAGLLPDIVSAMTSSNSIAFVNDEIDETLPNNIAKKNGSGNWEALTIELTDASNIYCPTNVHSENIVYTRNFSNTNWQALYVPFGMEYDDWAEDFVIARLNDVHQFDDDDDGVIDRTALESVKLKAGSSVEPNTPYLIKAKTAGEKTITLTDATLYATAENSYDVTSWYTRFIFTGTYHTVTDMATQGHYALSGGGLKLATSDAVQLKPFRWYVDITDRNGDPIPSMANAPIYIVFDDGEETSIEGITAELKQQNDDVYTVSGVKVTDKDTLPKGVYIKNGKKVMVK